MSRVRCLFVCTTKYNASVLKLVANELPDWDCYFTPTYSTPTVTYRFLRRTRLIDRTPLSNEFQARVLTGMQGLGLRLDLDRTRRYDLIVLGNDFFIPQNLRHFRPKVLVQEGWVWPFSWRRRIGRALHIPPLLIGANGAGLSGCYDYFCVASTGYRDLFSRSGVHHERMIVTGLPLLDNIVTDLAPMRDASSESHFVLLATHPGREYFEGEKRRNLLLKTRRIARGRPIVVKFHPHEDTDRAAKEVRSWMPEATISTEPDIRRLISNCSELVTTYSTVIFYALALNKPVHCSYPIRKVTQLVPEQNHEAAQRIASVCRTAHER